jgi:hypothetical protein
MLVQQLHDEALEGAVALIDLLQSLPKSPVTGQPDIAAGRNDLRVLLGEISKTVDVLEDQMNREVHPRTAVTDHAVELTGRRGIGQQVVTGDRSQSESATRAGNLPR